MFLQNDNLGLIVGLGIGSAIGSVATIFILNKIKKKEKQDEIDKISEFYNKKIKEILTEKKKVSVEENKPVVEPDKKSEIIIKNPSPKTIMQDKVSKLIEENDNNDDPADMNEGYAVLEVDRGFRPSQNNINSKTDYTKFSKTYENLVNEYERQEEKEEIVFPKQITKDDYDMSGAYSKQELTYYEQNGYFVDDCDDILEEYDENYFGLDNLSKFGTDAASLDGLSGLYEIYLRDETLRIDFHIIYNGTIDFNRIGTK